MGIFDLFKNKEELKDSPWHIIESEAELKRAIEESYHHKVAIFKHSTRCFISKMVLKNFENGLRNSTPSDYKFYYLDLLQFKPLSNKISEDLMIRHESPQLIVLEGGKAIYNASHENISRDLLP